LIFIDDPGISEPDDLTSNFIPYEGSSQIELNLEDPTSDGALVILDSNIYYLLRNLDLSSGESWTALKFIESNTFNIDDDDIQIDERLEQPDLDLESISSYQIAVVAYTVKDDFSSGGFNKLFSVPVWIGTWSF
ncbi:MAG: hypothetical protein PF447_01050, partial [Spirochaetaceae bacterium]|nr:hypothetical protein [Spirochaetaceae bacterium]